MKKILIIIVATILIMSVFIPVAFAEGEQFAAVPNNQGAEERGQNKEEREQRKEDREAAREARKAERELMKAEFEERKLERALIRTATKEQLKEQLAIIKGYKEQLQALRETIEGLPEEERAEYADEIAALKAQVKDAQKYRLVIRAESKEAIREIFPGVKASGFPTTEDVDAFAPIVDEL